MKNEDRVIRLSGKIEIDTQKSKSLVVSFKDFEIHVFYNPDLPLPHCYDVVSPLEQSLNVGIITFCQKANVAFYKEVKGMVVIDLTFSIGESGDQFDSPLYIKEEFVDLNFADIPDAILLLIEEEYLERCTYCMLECEESFHSILKKFQQSIPQNMGK